MSNGNQRPLGKRWTPDELRKLPAEQRNSVLAAAAQFAEQEYCTDEDLTDFEAFGPDDLHGDRSNTQSR